MSKKKKIIIGSSIGVVVIAIAVLLLVFAFDAFGLFTADYKLNYDKYIKIGNYKGLEYDKADVSVTKKDIKAEVENFLKTKSQTKTIKSGTVKKGDTIAVSYEGRINGKTFEGGSAKNTNITIGQTSMIDGFVDGLIGEKVGKTKKLHLRFPKNYANNKKLSNKKVVFTVKILSKQQTVKPKYNVAFVKKNTNFKTVKAYEASVKENLVKKKTTEAAESTKKTLWSRVVADSKIIKYPERQLKFEEDQIISRYKKMAKSYNMSWTNFLKNYMNSNEKAFEKQAKEYAKTVVKQKLTMYAIAKKEGIKVTDKEYKEYLAKILKQAGFTEESFKKQYKQSIDKYAKENGIKSNLLLQKITDKVMKEAKEKTSKNKKTKKN